MSRFRTTILLALSCFLVGPVFSHVKGRPSVHDTLAEIVGRLKETYAPKKLAILTLNEVEAILTEEDKEILGTEYLTFEVDVPVTVSVVHDARLKNDPFWLAGRGFQAAGAQVMVDRRAYAVWEKDFEPGRVGLGVPSLTGGGEHYFVAIRPKNPGAELKVTEIYPGQHTLGEMRVGEKVYIDHDAEIVEPPDSIEGAILLRGSDDKQYAGQLVNLFRLTRHPATLQPDQIVLTWSEDPKTTQTVQWRTAPQVKTGVVAYRKRADYRAFNPKKPTLLEAETKPLETPELANDPLVNRHTAVIRGLEPATTYVYSVGDGSEGGWSDPAEFTTAPPDVLPFSFIYMGDAQNGLDRWGSLAKQAFLKRPDASFWVMAGDLINRGPDRDDWDDFFFNCAGIYDRRTLVPCLGNHEYQRGDPWLYLETFTLPTNGPPDIGPERGYSFEYSNALFVVLDSNLPPEKQTAWLEETLANSTATWKFAVYHHPAYSSGAERDNPEVRRLWGKVFDKYHVDVALQGHDHAYLRTYPMKAERKVDSAKDGTIYIVSVSGTKFYEQGEFDYTEFGLTNTATYQVLDILVSGDTLTYKAHDLDGNAIDSFTIDK